LTGSADSGVSTVSVVCVVSCSGSND
jgi:hypothetical protein